MAPHWKCGSRQRVGGSNPPLSAIHPWSDPVSPSTGFVLADADDPDLGEFYGKYRVKPRPVLAALDAAGLDRRRG